MTFYNKASRRSSRTDRPSNPDRRHRASFARQVVFAEFGHHARALDQDDFVDRLPGQAPTSSPEGRVAFLAEEERP